MIDLKKKNFKYILVFIMILSMLTFTACSDEESSDSSGSKDTAQTQTTQEQEKEADEKAVEEPKTEEPATKIAKAKTPKAATFSIKSIPKFKGRPYVEINKNKPTFKKKQFTKKSYEKYSNLDELGRCGVAIANVGKDIMPAEKRGSIGMIKPSGWETIRYDFVDGKYLYNRCHLIGYQLTGENANPRNLITGTRYMNNEGMLPFENEIDDYVDYTGNHVLYRVEPIFVGSNLVAKGVHMEARSVEDGGNGVSFNVFVYNNQPGVKINYATGSSKSTGKYASSGSTKSKGSSNYSSSANSNRKGTYIVNLNTKKFHKPSCYSVTRMTEKNKKIYKGKRKSLISNGYEPCKSCNP